MNKRIEKLKTQEGDSIQIQRLTNKINEIIDYLNKERE